MNLTDRLLNPETVEEALKEFGAEWQYKTVVRELHERLKTAKAEGAAEELAALVNNQTIHAESGSILVNAADLEPQAWINVRVIRDRAAEIRKQVQG